MLAHRKRAQQIVSSNRSCLGRDLRNRIHQLTRSERLVQTSNAACHYCLLVYFCVVEGGHENDRELGAGSCKLTPQCNSRRAAKIDIEEETIELRCSSAIKEFLCGTEEFSCKSTCVQQMFGGHTHTGVIIHDRHDIPPLLH